MMINVLNGTLDIGIGEIQEIRSQLEAGRCGSSRPATASGCRASRECRPSRSGLDVVLDKFRGLAGPKGLPDDIVRHGSEAIKRCSRIPRTRRY